MRKVIELAVSPAALGIMESHNSRCARKSQRLGVGSEPHCRLSIITVFSVLNACRAAFLHMTGGELLSGQYRYPFGAE